MSAVTWGALGFLLLVLVAALVVFTVLCFRGWRLLVQLRRELLASLEELNTSVVALERRLGSVDERTAELQHRVEHLSVTLARARALVGAAREVGDLVTRVRGVVPSK